MRSLCIAAIAAASCTALLVGLGSVPARAADKGQPKRESRAARHARIRREMHALFHAFEQPTSNSRDAVHRRWDDNVREAVVRHLIADRGGFEAQAYYVARGRAQDPPAAFLARFRDVAQPVRKCSQCGPFGFGVADRTTGEVGIILVASSVRWSGRTTAVVAGGYHFDGLGAQYEFYIVHRKNRRWIVIGTTGIGAAS